MVHFRVERGAGRQEPSSFLGLADNRRTTAAVAAHTLVEEAAFPFGLFSSSSSSFEEEEEKDEE